MNFPYNRVLNRDEVLVAFVDEARSAMALATRKGIHNAGKRYGFEVSFGHDRAHIDGETYRLKRHLIFQCSEDGSKSALPWVIGLMQRGWTASVAIVYRSLKSSQNHAELIERWKQTYGDNLNILRPDVSNGRSVYVSCQKLIDNAICDTVRIKYTPVRITVPTIGVELCEAERAFFAEASELYGRAGLYHRSPCDGYFAMRSETGGFLITATKTNKIDIDLRRIVRVHLYDPESNQLHYSGNFLPSSDSVEAAMVFQRLFKVNALVHTHASRLFTRNPAYSDRILVPCMPYGEAQTGERLVEALNSQAKDFAIMKEHGEVFAAVGESARGMFQKIEQEILSAAASCVQ
jgi:Class II Aldolase and Adducin N-terminal domain